MRQVAMFTEDELKTWYSTNQLDLDWLEKPSRHQFRWRLNNDRWVTLARQVSHEQSLRKQFSKQAPRDLYIGTSAWLNPVDLPRLKDEETPPPILLDHLVVFDIDFTPFCYERLEHARRVTNDLLKWLEQHEDLSLLYISYSGGKGFHLVLKDNDRAVFGTPDPRLREQKVRESRKELLNRVLEAGFEVDPTVTADTRRIIRLPGSLHGTTGWCCTRISREQLNQPLKTWRSTIPRHNRHARMKYLAFGLGGRWNHIASFVKRPFRRKKNKERPPHKEKPTAESLSMQMSSQVVGTKGRSALMAWIPTRWKEQQRRHFIAVLVEKGWTPIHNFTDGTHEFIIVPRAIPIEQLRKVLPKLGLQRLATEIGTLGHYWIDMSIPDGEEGKGTGELTHVGRWDPEASVTRVPWSSTHIEAIRRLGVDMEIEGDIAGRAEPAMRIVTKV